MNDSQRYTSRNPGFDIRMEMLHNELNSILWPFENSEEKIGTLLRFMHDTYKAKDSDYSADGKPMGNLRVSEKLGIPAWKAVLLRMNDKKSRVESFIARGSFLVDDEKVTDTLVDMAVYALLGSTLHAEVHEDMAVHIDGKFLSVAIDAIRCKLAMDSDQTWSHSSWYRLTETFDSLGSYATTR